MSKYDEYYESEDECEFEDYELDELDDLDDLEDEDEIADFIDREW